jgi:hypothetical protein
MTDAEEQEIETLERRHEKKMRALHERKVEQDQHIQALLDAIRELKRKNDILERECAAKKANATN